MDDPMYAFNEVEFPTLGDMSASKCQSKRIHELEDDHEDKNYESNSKIGVRLLDYTEEIAEMIIKYNVGKLTDFIMMPIEPVRASYCHTNKFQPIPDFAAPANVWRSSIMLDLGHVPIDNFHFGTSERFDLLLRHSIYLNCSSVITCPTSDAACLAVASVVNDRLAEIRNPIEIIFRYPVEDSHFNDPTSWIYSQDDSTNESHDNSVSSSNGQELSQPSVELNWTNNSVNDSHLSSKSPIMSAWKQWDDLRSHLNADSRIGVCLHLRDEISDDEEELARWSGEPVKVIILSTNQFYNLPSGKPKLNPKCHEFIKRVIPPNSFNTRLAIEPGPGEDTFEHIIYLRRFMDRFKVVNQDWMSVWNDQLTLPLQPLSSNLDSGTYSIFESDLKKYRQYQVAMRKAILELIARSPDQKKFTLMVLGAGRGPLVDQFIKAIKSIDKNEYHFKIYALDKNPSSVRSLHYKSIHLWPLTAPKEVDLEIVESDMRLWKPSETADIIATELLGSFGDNELSPECIDGTWAFSTPKTISIPQIYSSHIAPICSYKMCQQLYTEKYVNRQEYVYDKIYVVRLANYYAISRPQQLFTFEHLDLSLPPEQRCNKRYRKLEFLSKVDTVCHGFAGYFSAQLFSEVRISILLGQETVDMNSWYPVFIPLDNPIPMPKGTRLEVHFWRKESKTKVWYEWAVTYPTRTRIHSQNGFETSMSKFS